MKVAEGEEEFDRPEPALRPEAVPAAGSGTRIRLLFTIACVIAALCVGASVYFLGTTPVPGVKVSINVWFGAGAGVAAALAWLGVVKLGPRLAYQKPGQGRWARGTAYAGLAVMAVFGAVALHRLPEYGSRWYRELGVLPVFGKEFIFRPVLFPAVAFCLVSMVAVHLYVSRPRSVDFLIDTQGEMRRVSWPTRREWIGSTLVVLFLVTALSVFLYVADHYLSQVMQGLKIGF